MLIPEGSMGLALSDVATHFRFLRFLKGGVLGQAFFHFAP